MFASLFKRLARRTRSRPAAPRSNRFRPRLEALEDRQLLASAFVVGDVLMIASNDIVAKNDKVIITDYGTGGAGNISVKIGNSAPTTFNSIGAIEVHMKGGKDKVTYDLAVALQPNVSREVTVYLGDGDDTFTLKQGKDLLEGSSFKLDVFGGPHNDTLRLSQGPSVGIIGTDKFAVLSNFYIAPNAVFDVNLNGGSGVDTISCLYAGELDGQYLLNVDGGSGNYNDKLWAWFYLRTGSTGKLGDLASEARLYGGDGNDTNMYYRVCNDGTAEVFALIGGGPGNDTGKRTANVDYASITTSIIAC